MQGNYVEVGVQEKIDVCASVKLSMYDGGDSMTQKMAHHVERNIKGSIKRKL